MPVSKTSSARPRDAAPGLADLPDRAAMEAFVARLGQEGVEVETDRAQQCMYDAWDAPTAAKARARVREALKISPLCADAYLWLMQDRRWSADEELDLIRRAVTAGELALGPEAFEELAGDFWGFLETRPYMRALHYLGLALGRRGEAESAAAVYRDMLKLNPNDNQGVRYLLLDQLFLLGRDAEITALLDQYPHDGAAYWPYGRVLLAFRDAGDGPAARALLTQAREANPHVPDFLLGRRRIPANQAGYIVWGAESEAASYAEEGRAVSAATPGALAWLEAAVEPGERASRPRRTGKG